jgi:hypothetical protein
MSDLSFDCPHCGFIAGITVHPEEKATRDHPGWHAHIEPEECPGCGSDLDAGAVLELWDSICASRRDDDADARRKEAMES